MSVKFLLFSQFSFQRFDSPGLLNWIYWLIFWRKERNLLKKKAIFLQLIFCQKPDKCYPRWNERNNHAKKRFRLEAIVQHPFWRHRLRLHRTFIVYPRTCITPLSHHPCTQTKWNITMLFFQQIQHDNFLFRLDPNAAKRSRMKSNPIRDCTTTVFAR